MAAPLSRSTAAVAAALAVLLAAFTGEVSAQRRGSRLASGAPSSSSSASNAAVDFDCPEEFGYYPHPTDCTQYYVCVFGGALVESCTGGLMYSHELQTCDWPRNVGCGAGEGATVSTVRVTDPRTRQTTPSALPPSRAPVAVSRGQQEQQRQQQEEIVKHQLYAEDVGPAEEVEIDRQQRVYRGQPSTLGQVQRDRDGLRHQPVNNVIPAPTGRASSGDKIAVISFGTQQQAQPVQYSSDLLTQDNYLTFETPQRRVKRQIQLRFPQQIAPQSQRLPFWSAPQPPPVGRLPPAQSFSSSPPESHSSSGFRPIPNPGVVRNFRSSELRSTQASLQPTHNANTFHPLSPHSVFSTPETRINIPNSNRAFQKASSPVISTALTLQKNAPSKYFVPFGNSSQLTYTQNLPGIIYYTPLGDENYSFFNLGGSHFQSAPPASQQFNSQNQNHFPVNQPVHGNANPVHRNEKQSNVKQLRPLTSMHELPYNENGKPLFRVADEPDTLRNADALIDSALKTGQGASQFQINLPTVSVQESIRHQVKVPATLEQHGITYYNEPSAADGIINYYEPNIYSHVPSKYHSSGESYTSAQNSQNHARHKEIPSREQYLPRKIPDSGSTLSAYDSHTQDSNAKLLRATAAQQNRHDSTELRPEPRQRPNKSSPGKLYPDQNESDYDEDDVDEKDHDNHFYQPPPDFFEEVNKFSHIENPFADINFDFDTYIEKLRGEIPKQEKLNDTDKNNIKLNDSELENNKELETSEEGTAVEEEAKTKTSTDSDSGVPGHSFIEETTKYSQPYIDKAKTETVPVATQKINRSRGGQRDHAQQDTHRKLPAVPVQQPAKQRGTPRITNNHDSARKTHVTEAATSLRGRERHYKLAEQPTSPIYDKGKAVTTQPYIKYEDSQTYDQTTHKNFQRIPQSVKEYAQTTDASYHTSSSRTNSAPDKERPFGDYAAQEENSETSIAGYEKTNNHDSESTTLGTKSNKRILPNRQNSDSLDGNYFQGGSHSSSETTDTAQKQHIKPDRELQEQGQNSDTYDPEWQRVNDGKITSQHPIPFDTTTADNTNRAIPEKDVDTPILNVGFVENSPNDGTVKATFKHNVVNYLPRDPNHTHLSFTNISNSQENNKINVLGRQNKRRPVSLNLQSSSNRTVPPTYNGYPVVPTDTTNPNSQLLLTTSKTQSVARRLRSRRPTSTSLPIDSLNYNDYSPTLSRPSVTVNPYSQRPLHKETTEQSRMIKRPKDSDSDIGETYDRPLPSSNQLIKDEYGNENTIRVEPSNSYQPQPQSAVPTNPTVYNSSQQYDTAAQYDPYYNNYDEDVELYRDIVDYGQYTGSQNNQQQPYRGNQNTYKTAPQPTAPQRTNSYVQPSYSSQDIYTQQQQQPQQQQPQDYSDSYNTQLSDEQYREPSRTPSRPQGRGRGDNAASARAGPSQNDKTEELDASLNLSPLASDAPRSSSRPPTTSTRQQQFQARGQNTESEGRRAPVRPTSRTSTSLEETLSEDQKSLSRGQAGSRRTPPSSESPVVKPRVSDTTSLPVSRVVPQKQQTSGGRRAPVKYYESSDTSQGSRSSAKNPELTNLDGFRQGSSENRRGSQLKLEASPDVEAVVTPRSQKVVADSFQPARLISSVDDTQNDDDEIADPDFPSKSLSRNSIVQSEPSTTSRSRSRGSSSSKQAQCSDDVDSNKNTGCIEKQQVRVRPTTASPESQTTPTPSRTPTVNRNRGSSPYVSNSGSDTVNRGTPASVRTRPTLKPSTAFVSKAQEFVDIYKYPPSRPAPVYPQPQVDKTAAKCRKDVCLLPDCFCGGKDIPENVWTESGDLRPEEVPQLVLLTFDDAVNDLNKNLYRDLFEKGRRNPNGCDIAATFYVSHEWTDYGQVQDLYAGGHEIATHSVSHSFGEQFSQKKWSKEIGGQREILAQYGGVKLEDVRGMRAPFLAIGGNKMFKMLYDLNFTYDSSMPVYENRPPSWPYTLDYKIFHDCMIPPCPTRSYPGVWEVPMVMWQDLNGGRCSMGDACSNPPTADGVYKMLIKNFERHYTTNRAPFGLFYHAAWFTQPHHKEGFEAFLDTIVAMDDVWLVTNWQAIQWVRQPTPLSEIKNFPPFQCNYADRPKKCNNPKVCNLWHKSGVRYMRTCQPCPEVYPWTGKTGVKNSRIDNEIYEET